ncbi:MAG: lytic transglycosylase domain-containing protein [Nitrospiraceae bacterium]|nr:lytic transglycosylase domain-containing protein [Nitrospiraceae bacterium]
MILIFSSAAPAFAFCFEAAGAEYGVSPRLLWSIAKVESDFSPRAVNWNQNGTYDYGLMQINSTWAPKLGMGVWRSLGDPCSNVRAGAWILARCVRKYGYTWEAVGCYNASNERKRQKYEREVYAVFKRYFRQH